MASLVLTVAESQENFKAAKLKTTTPEDVNDYLRKFPIHWGREWSRVLSLDVKNGVVADDLVSLGTATMGLVSPRDVFRTAILKNCPSIIFSHYHPSGDVTPSAEDIALTKKLVAGGKLLDVEVLDHVILAGDSFLSLRRKGLLGA